MRPDRLVERSVVAIVVAIFGVLAMAVISAELSRAAFSGATTNSGNQFGTQSPFPATTFRTTTYELGSGTFTGTTYTLTLNNDLQPNYFVMIQGGSGDDSTGGNRAPDDVYARVDADPFAGNFTSAPQTPANQIRLRRDDGSFPWKGTVTVVESMQDHTGSGFQLIEVAESSLGAGVTNFAHSMGNTWANFARVAAYGGHRGGGVTSTRGSTRAFQGGWARVYPSQNGGGNQQRINFEREGEEAASLNGTAVFTTYVVEWGSEWTIQRATVTGSAGGGSINSTTEYSTAAISPVARDNTFVLAYGRTARMGIGTGWEGQAFTLGDGVNQNATESLVAIGAEYAFARTAEVYVHTHPSLVVDHVFDEVGGGRGMETAEIGGLTTVAPAREADEAYTSAGGVSATGPRRFSILSNSLNGTGRAFPRPFVWSRHTASTDLTWARSRSGQPGDMWLQSVDFAHVLK